MLKEINKIRQYDNEPFRRWFWSPTIDLTVWYNKNNGIIGFQLCYKKSTDDKALTWFKDKGFTHDTIDDGEGGRGGHKMTPILMPDGVFEKDKITQVFEEECIEMEQETAHFVLEKLKSYE